MPGRASSGFEGHQGLHPKQGSSQLTVEQITDIPVLGGGLQGFLPDDHLLANQGGGGGRRGFRTFLHRKKSTRVTAHPGSELGDHSSSSTPWAQMDGFFIDDPSGVWMPMDTGRWKLLCAVGRAWVRARMGFMGSDIGCDCFFTLRGGKSGSGEQSLVLAGSGPVVSRQSQEAHRRISLSTLRCCLRCSHLEIWCIISLTASYLAVTSSVSGCCLWSTGYGFFRR